jgi:tetratricopeptide (TPR) repeat protein
MMIIEYTNNSLKKEDYDIGIKLGHILTAQQKYTDAYRLYKSIIKKSGNNKNTNAFLGMCTTHFQIKENNGLKEILKTCEKAIESLIEEKIEGKDLKNKTLAIAYYNKGCVEMRAGKYPKALVSFKDGEMLNGKNKYLNSAVIFSNILTADYKEAIRFANGKNSRSDTVPKDYSKDVFMGLGVANLALASDAEISSDDRILYYSNASKNFDIAQVKNSPDSYLKKYLEKAEECKTKEHVNSKYCMQEWSPVNDSKLKKYIHSRFLAFVTQYQMNQIVADVPVKFINKDQDNELDVGKGKACTLIKERK